MTVENPEPLLTPGEVALMFRVDPKTVTRWASARAYRIHPHPRGTSPVPRVGDPWSARRTDRRFIAVHSLNQPSAVRAYAQETWAGCVRRVIMAGPGAGRVDAVAPA